MIARASSWTSGEVARAVGGVLHGTGGEAIAGVSTDTRDALARALFVAIEGPRFDGHDFLPVAVDKGAAALLVAGDRRAAWEPFVQSGRCAVVVVDAPLPALGDLARAWRRRHDPVVIGLTGSNGKTSTKDILSSVLRSGHAVLSTEGNLNNLIGLPMTLLGLTPQDAVAVVEMGMNASGEIRRLAEIAEPDVGLVINVGPAHLGELGSLEAIAAAKGELFDTMSPGHAVKVANLDDPRVCAQARKKPGHVRWFSAREEADVQVVARQAAGDGQVVKLAVDGREVVARLAYAGHHQALNAAAAVAAATALPGRLPLSLEQVRQGLEAARPAQGRFTVHHHDDRVLIDDGYNANPASVAAAVSTAAGWAAREGRSLVVVLGEMRELGRFSAAEHAAVGRLVAQEGARILGTLGPDAVEASTAAAELGVETHHEDDDVGVLAEWLRKRIGGRDLILLKGSRGIRTERLIPFLSGGG